MIPEPEHPPPSGDRYGRDQAIEHLLEIIAGHTRQLNRLQARLNRLAACGQDTGPTGDDDENDGPAEPAPWVWFSPPAASEDDPTTSDDPRETVTNFVAWYNATFIGVDGSRATPIPGCWHHHPGLAAELATLAYTWRAANIGPNATARDAHQWHHQWRPGLLERLTRDWTHPDCLHGHHRPAGAEPRPDRHTLAEHHAHTAHHPDQPPNQHLEQR